VVRRTHTNFTALFPGQPKEQALATLEADGKRTLHRFMCEMPEKRGSYGVVYTDFELNPGWTLDPDETLDDLRDKVLAELHAKLLSEKVISLGGSPGRELMLEYRGQAQIQMRSYLVNTRLYQIIAGSSEFAAASHNIETFFDSFKLLSK
jgi:hypothetical protein